MLLFRPPASLDCVPSLCVSISPTRCKAGASARPSDGLFACGVCFPAPSLLSEALVVSDTCVCVARARSREFFVAAEASIAAFSGVEGGYSAIHNRQGDWEKVRVVEPKLSARNRSRRLILGPVFRCRATGPTRSSRTNSLRPIRNS